MIVIGITSQMRKDADRRCRSGFRAWIAEVGKSTWGNWAELQRQYPDVHRTHGDEAHFPLTADGTGVLATACFKPGLLRLQCIAAAPKGATAQRKSTQTNKNPNEKTNTL